MVQTDVIDDTNLQGAHNQPNCWFKQQRKPSKLCFNFINAKAQLSPTQPVKTTELRPNGRGACASCEDGTKTGSKCYSFLALSSVYFSTIAWSMECFMRCVVRHWDNVRCFPCDIICRLRKKMANLRSAPQRTAVIALFAEVRVPSNDTLPATPPDPSPRSVEGGYKAGKDKIARNVPAEGAS